MRLLKEFTPWNLHVNGKSVTSSNNLNPQPNSSLNQGAEKI